MKPAKNMKNRRSRRRNGKPTQRTWSFKKKLFEKSEFFNGEREKMLHVNIKSKEGKLDQPAKQLLPGPSSYIPFIPDDDVLNTISKNKIIYAEAKEENGGDMLDLEDNNKSTGSPNLKQPEYKAKPIPIYREYDIDEKFKKNNKARKEALRTSEIPVDSKYWHPAILEAEPPRNPKYNFHDKHVTLSDGIRVKVRMFRDKMITVFRLGETKHLRLPEFY